MSAGMVVYFVMGLIALGFFYLLYGVLVDEMIVELNDQFADPLRHTSQERMDAADGVTWYWAIVPIILLIGMFVYGLVVALRETSGNISEGW